LHQPALDRLGIPAVYERWHTAAADLPARINSLRQPDALGASVTVPHKLATLELVDEGSDAARRAGAVNTVVNCDGSLYGDNTDIHGFMTSLQEALGGSVPEVALVLGAGGAARAVVLALEATGIGEIVVANRDLARGNRLAADLAPAPVRTVALNDSTLARELPRAGLLVNATSLGWHAGEMPLAPPFLDRLPGDALVADLTYRDTDLLLAAAARSLRTLDGLGMLVYQGVRAFELWTGYPAPIPIMLEAARAARSGA
jgi:shikimate dehydrogenase